MNNSTQIWLDIAALVLKYGIPAVREIIAGWADDMTPEQIKSKMIEEQGKMKKSEEYFK